MTASSTPTPLPPLVHECLVAGIIIINALVMFLDAFPDLHAATGGLLAWIFT